MQSCLAPLKVLRFPHHLCLRAIARAQLKEAAAADGLNTLYLENEGVATGTCAVLISGGERSLMANLAAAEKYDLPMDSVAYALVLRTRVC